MMSPAGAAGRHVPIDIQRQLWAESIGHCMRPSCQIDLLASGHSIAEMAHIDAHASGGEISPENLILLCRNCHKGVDSVPPLALPGELRAWKAQRNKEVEQKFALRFATFDELQKSITPILQRNGQIFRDYGPDNDSPDSRTLWLQFEGEIIANNRRIEIALRSNKGLLHRENQDIVDEFFAHAQEFISTRQESVNTRINLFPADLLSIFGLKEIETGLVPNVSALQNFIARLVSEGKFRELELVREQTVRYEENGELHAINLNNRPRVQQIFWNGKFYRPNATKLRLDGLVFFVKWLSRNHINWKFNDIRNLAELTIGEYQVALIYEYQASLAVIQAIPVVEKLLIVNLHNWNDGPFTAEATKHARDLGMRVFNQTEFFRFARGNLK